MDSSTIKSPTSSPLPWDLLATGSHLFIDHHHPQNPLELPQPIDPLPSPTSFSGACEPSCDDSGDESQKLCAMKEMIYKIAAMQPVDIDPATIKKPKRRNVRISDDPQSVAARRRRERISEKIRILQRLVPGGTKMDTASMLDEAIRYVKFLKRQVQLLQDNSSPAAVEWPPAARPEGSRMELGFGFVSDGPSGGNVS